MAENAVNEAIANGTQEGPAGRPRTTTCACLCGGATAPRSTFLQGHDQRFISLLAAEVTEGSLTNARVEQLQLPTEVDGWDIQERINLTSNAVSKFFSEALAVKFNSAAHRRWEKLGKGGKNDPAGDGASKQEATVEEVQQLLDTDPTESEQLVTGAPIRVKVGRWEYDATIHGMNQSGKVTAVRYYDRNDKEFVKTEGQFKIVK